MSNFVDKRIGFHSASRLPLHSQQALAAAMNVDGHIVTDSQIWTAKAEDFPVNRDLTSQDKANFKTSTDIVGATDDLITVFTGGNEISNSDSGSKTFKFVEGVNTYEIKSVAFNGGRVWTNEKYPAVKLYQNVKMNTIAGSDGAESGGKFQAYHVVGTDGKRIVDWIPPTAVIDSETGSPVAGYSGKAEVSKDNVTWSCLQDCDNSNYAWKLSDENWEFVFMSGILRFNPLYTPTTSGFGYDYVRWTGFQYIGPRLSSDVSDIKNDISDLKSEGISWIILSEESNSVSNA